MGFHDGENFVYRNAKDGKIVDDDFFRKGYENTNGFQKAAAQWQRGKGSNDWNELQMLEDIARANNVPAPYADDWSQYAVNAGYPIGTPVPIDDIADRTRENGWWRGEELRDGVLGNYPTGKPTAWRYYPAYDRRIDNRSQLQKSYDRMMRYLGLE